MFGTETRMKPVTVYDQAEVLTALLVLGGLCRVPDHSGILDRALRRCHDDLPAELRSTLSYSETSVGLRCLELPTIVLAGLETGLFAWTDRGMAVLQLRLSPSLAREEAVAHGALISTYLEIGKQLSNAILEAIQG